MTRQKILAIAKPILFNTEMVGALLEGRKTVTRRVVAQNVMYKFVLDGTGKLVGSFDEKVGDCYPTVDDCRYQVGDYLYVRETWAKNGYGGFFYKSDGKCEVFSWHPSLHMPKEAARIFLRVTDVRVERLQEITEEQAKAEGAELLSLPMFVGKGRSYIQGFGHLWDSTVKKSYLSLYGWNASPWVWVIEFERVEVSE